MGLWTVLQLHTGYVYHPWSCTLFINGSLWDRHSLNGCENSLAWRFCERSPNCETPLRLEACLGIFDQNSMSALVTEDNPWYSISKSPWLRSCIVYLLRFDQSVHPHSILGRTNHQASISFHPHCCLGLASSWSVLQIEWLRRTKLYLPSWLHIVCYSLKCACKDKQLLKILCQRSLKNDRLAW